MELNLVVIVKKAKEENKKYFDSFEKAKFHLSNEKETKICHFYLKEYGG